ncbi:NAD(P)-binding protein, partial [Mycobacterium tuberculosis]|uniref:FAD-dependent oxidoreductase n=2 Tax=Bacteria TaxID=2 RepID=UPI001ADFC0E3|nr:NAD(P)-binding protein [Mycobacterium tuberculosis]
MDSVDVLIVGGGQSGLSAGYFLRRSGLSYVILDAETSPGGAWQHAWHSLHLFSPAGWSSIPGWPMPASQGPYP